jgi:hypothetical protein
MTTYAVLIEAAETDARAAKRAADVAREVSRSAPADPALRVAAAAAADAAADAGRNVAAVRFEEQLDRWVDRFGAGDVLADELLMQLAPRDHRGVVDAYWLAAAHLARAGAATPRNWRSPTGEPVHAISNPSSNQPDQG